MIYMIKMNTLFYILSDNCQFYLYLNKIKKVPGIYNLSYSSIDNNDE